MDDIVGTLKVRTFGYQRDDYGTAWGGLQIVNPFTRLYWLHHGAGLVKPAGAAGVPLAPGRLYLFPAHRLADYSCSRPMRLDWVHLTAEVLGGAMDLATMTELPPAVAPESPALVQALFDRFMAIPREPTPANELERDGILRQLLAPFVTVAERDGVLARRLQEIGRFQAVIEHMDAQLHQPQTLAGLAEIAHLHPTYFSNLFSRRFGMPPLQYLNRRRIERAQGRLWDDTVSVAQVAAELGFSDQFHFSRTFKHYTGLSPLQYRQQRLLHLNRGR